MNGQRRLTILSGRHSRSKKVVGRGLAVASMSHSRRSKTLTGRLVKAGVALLFVAAISLPARAFAEREHTVSKGQTLARIAAKYGIAVSTLAAANGLTNAEHLRPGQVLLVPPRGV